MMDIILIICCLIVLNEHGYYISPLKCNIVFVPMNDSIFNLWGVNYIFFMNTSIYNIIPVSFLYLDVCNLVYCL